MEPEVVEKMKIYVFVNSTFTFGHRTMYECYAMSDAGELLASHLCSDTYYMTWDLVNRPDRQFQHADKFPEGYEVVTLPLGESPSDDVYERGVAAGFFVKSEEERPVETTFLAIVEDESGSPT